MREMQMEKVVKCPRCPAEAVVKNGDDVSDTRYKLTCPDIHERLAMEGSAATPECPYMRPVRDAALREFRRGV
jgi:transposase-like protein